MAGARDEAELWAELRETQMEVSSWREIIAWLTKLRNGNGADGLETQLKAFRSFMHSRQRIEWLVIGTLIVALIGVAVSLGQAVAISGLKTTLENQVHPAVSVNKQQPHDSGGGS